MVDTNKLKGAIIAKGKSIKDIAVATDEKYATINARINKPYMDSRFIEQLIEILGLNLEESYDIFLAKKDN